jgi:hypothetical protein
MSRSETFLNPIPRNCKTCGKSFEVDPDEQKSLAEKGFTLPTHCPECRQKKHSIAVITCKDCSEKFELTESEGDFYERNGLAIPKRCPECRRKRKEARK